MHNVLGNVDTWVDEAEHKDEGDITLECHNECILNIRRIWESVHD